MSYTNVTVPYFHNHNIELREQIQILELKNKNLSDRLLQVIHTLENIPQAVRDHGFVEITLNNKTIRLIEEPNEKY